MVTIIVHTLIIPASILLVCSVSLFPLFWPLLAVYLLLIVLDTRAEQGLPLLWIQKWFRNLWWWRAFAYYYPIRLHKTVDLSPADPPLVKTSWKSLLLPWNWADSTGIIVLWPFFLLAKFVFRILGLNPPVLPPSKGRKYLFGISPHGIIAMGAFCALSTEGAGWSQLFPGVPVRLLTLSSNFFFPFYRQYLLALGMSSVSKQSCLNHLNNNQSIAIVTGGARESLLAKPGHFDIILDDRKGFIKVALQTGASLVPVLSFGENDIYEQVEFPRESLGHKILMFMTNYFGFTIPLFHARGVFDYQSGVIAYRRPIDVVIGKPIDVRLNEDPTQEAIDHVHSVYIKQLKQLYADNVNKFTPGVELQIVQ